MWWGLTQTRFPELDKLRLWLPRGNTLPAEMWERRHRGIVALLAVHSLLIPLFGLARGVRPLHLVAESLIVPAATAYAAWPGAGRRVRTVAASVGLLSASAVLVHFSSGVIEMHFHFFVMVAVVSLYQDWLPFLTAVGYVFVHHAVLGSVDPRSVFNHPAAVNHPWRWALIHALFIAGISVACLITWRLNEDSIDQRTHAQDRLRQETQVVETLNRVGQSLAAELDLHTVLQRVTDAATQLSSAQFGAFFYNALNAQGESYQLYTISGVPAEAFSRFPMPRATAVFAPTFAGERPVRYADVTQEPTFGHSGPYFGMPPGHLPVHSYLAVPVVARDGEVYGGLFFGHEESGRFTETHERVVVGIASHATVAIENARLYESERNAARGGRSRRAAPPDPGQCRASADGVDRRRRDPGRPHPPAHARDRRQLRGVLVEQGRGSRSGRDPRDLFDGAQPVQGWIVSTATTASILLRRCCNPARRCCCPTSPRVDRCVHRRSERSGVRAQQATDLGDFGAASQPDRDHRRARTGNNP